MTLSFTQKQKIAPKLLPWAIVFFVVATSLTSEVLGGGSYATNSPTPATKTKAAYPEKTLSFSSSFIEIEASKAKVIRLSGEAKDVFVADPEIADVQISSPSLFFASGKKTGSTTIYAIGKDDKVLANINVTVKRNLDPLRSDINKITSATNINIRGLNTGIVLDGEVTNQKEAQEIASLAQAFSGASEKVVNNLRIASQTQVNLRVRVAEIERSRSNQLGFNWNANIGTGRELVNLITGRNFTGTNGLFNRATGDPASLRFRFGQSDVDINGVIDALANENLISVLAEPNLTALSGETASFLAGGEFPIPISSSNSDGSNNIQVQFKEFGVRLSFIPTVINDTRINLKLSPEVSELSDVGAVNLGNGFQIPGLRVRRTETTVEVGSGQSFAVSGLLKASKKINYNGIPGLMNIPIIGALFGSKGFEEEKTDLVFIVTAYIVKPVPAGIKLATPIDNLETPSNLQQILHHRFVQSKERSNTSSTMKVNQKELQGKAGFMLDIN